MNEAGFLLEEGVSIKDIDDACLNFGMPMGPFRLLDEVGIDVGDKVSKIIYDGLGERQASNGIGKQMLEKEFFGKKNAKGFYLYDEKGKPTGPNEAAWKMLPKASKKMSETEIQMRIFLPMINEAATTLEDKIVAKAKDVDLGLIFGIGFPPFRGGLLKYADTQGVKRLRDEMVKLSNSVNKDRFTPCELVNKLADEDGKFYEL